VPFKELVIAGFSLDFIAALLIIFLRNFLPPVVPLLYGRPGGVGQLVPELYLLIAPLAAIVLTIVNLLVMNFQENLFTRKILSASAFLISLLTTITIVKIILLVGFF